MENSKIQAPTITRIYRGSDGSALYLREVGNKVYGFGEHPGQKYAYVLHGVLQGDLIVAKFWGIPKGVKADFGPVDLQVTQPGNQLVSKGGVALFGAKTWQSIAPGSFPWPVRQAAGFQKFVISDLDGAFEGEDGSRHYIRELEEDVVWVAEAPAQPQERPAWVSVFVGKRLQQAIKIGNPPKLFNVQGMFADVPKGLTDKGGAFFAGTQKDRTLTLQQTNVNRTTELEPDYAIDWNIFEKTIRDALDSNGLVGYAYAAEKIWGWGRGQVSGAHGSRLLAVDGGPKPFTIHTESQALSTTKTITAVALVKALRNRNLTVDTKIAPFLPECWQKDKSIANITFRALLSHRSGLPRDSGDGEGYTGLRQLIANGITGEPGAYLYSNAAYALMRFLVPLVAHESKAKHLFTSVNCNDAAGNINQELSTMFCDYLFKQVLSPAEATASFNPIGDFAKLYNIDDPTQPGAGPKPNFFLFTGAGRLAISVINYRRFLRALLLGEILPPAVVSTMLQGELGFDPPAEGKAGVYYTKNGSVKHNGNAGEAQLMIYPSGVIAYIMANSDVGGSLKNLLKRAFDDALKLQM